MVIKPDLTASNRASLIHPIKWQARSGLDSSPSCSKTPAPLACPAGACIFLGGPRRLAPMRGCTLAGYRILELF